MDQILSRSSTPGEPAAEYPQASNFQNIDPKPSFGSPLTLDRLRFLEHRPADLVLAARRYIQPRDLCLTDMQKEAIRKWNEMDIMNNTDHFRFVPTQEILEKYFHVFDDLFFGGTLEENVAIVASATPNVVAGLKGITCQKFNIAQDCCYVPKSTITIYDDQHPIFGKRMSLLFGTLLHEMCHAFFQVYRCLWNCCDNGPLDLGPSGHGIMFQELACDIERMAARESVLGLELDLGRYLHLLIDICDEADWKVQMDVSTWGFDEQKTTNDLIIYKTRGLKSVPQ